jgi:hypothetical protein
MTDLRMFGYPARLILDLPDGEHDVSDAIELIVTPEMASDLAARTGFWVNTDRLLTEIAVEKRTRSRVRDAKVMHQPRNPA